MIHKMMVDNDCPMVFLINDANTCSSCFISMKLVMVHDGSRQVPLRRLRCDMPRAAGAGDWPRPESEAK